MWMPPVRMWTAPTQRRAPTIRSVLPTSATRAARPRNESPWESACYTSRRCLRRIRPRATAHPPTLQSEGDNAEHQEYTNLGEEPGLREHGVPAHRRYRSKHVVTSRL